MKEEIILQQLFELNEKFGTLLGVSGKVEQYHIKMDLILESLRCRQVILGRLDQEHVFTHVRIE